MSILTEQIRMAMIYASITPPEEIYIDAKKHRFSTNGDPKDRSGEYCIDPSKNYAGYFKDWNTGRYQELPL